MSRYCVTDVWRGCLRTTGSGTRADRGSRAESGPGGVGAGRLGGRHAATTHGRQLLGASCDGRHVTDDNGDADADDDDDNDNDDDDDDGIRLVQGA